MVFRIKAGTFPPLSFIFILKVVQSFIISQNLNIFVMFLCSPECFLCDLALDVMTSAFDLAKSQYRFIKVALNI